jgi:hypothetical protein
VLAPRWLPGISAGLGQFETDFSGRREGLLSNSCLNLFVLAAFVRGLGEAISLKDIEGLRQGPVVDSKNRKGGCDFTR